MDNNNREKRVVWEKRSTQTQNVVSGKRSESPFSRGKEAMFLNLKSAASTEHTLLAQTFAVDSS